MIFSKDNILALAVYTKRVGVAVFCQTELIYFAVKTINSPRTGFRVRRQVSQVMQKVFGEFKPKLLIVKTLTDQQTKSTNLQRAVSQIKKEALAAEIPLAEIAFEEAKQRICFGKKSTKANAFEALAKVYPELIRLTKFQNPSQAEYYNSLLSAIAIGFYFESKNKNDPEKIQI